MTIATAQPRMSWRDLIAANWQIYAIDGALLGLFMVSACLSVIALEHPSSPFVHWIGSPFFRRALIGACMGLTAMTLIYSPWGKRSGAFMNPAMVLSFVRLGRLTTVDAAGYIIAQFIGSVTGVAIVALFVPAVSHPSVKYVTTTPGSQGLVVAWLAEFIIAALMITIVMSVNKVPKLAPSAGCFAALLVFLFITFEAPISGMSLNPARTFGSSIVANLWTGWWIYLTAPVFGMFFGIEVQRRLTAGHQRLCGKLNHSRHVECFVRCQCIE